MLNEREIAVNIVVHDDKFSFTIRALCMDSFHKYINDGKQGVEKGDMYMYKMSFLLLTDFQ